MLKMAFRTIFFCLFLVVYMCQFAAANEWKSSTFDFSKVKTILVIEPTFTFTNAILNSKDRFEKYPALEALINDKFNAMLRGSKVRRVTESYIQNQIKGDPGLPVYEDVTLPEFKAIYNQELPKYADLILTLNIQDFGWYFEYHEPYDSIETETHKVRYEGKTDDGKSISGWIEVPEQVTVHHSADYKIYDSAIAKFSLIDPSSQKAVWTYTDSRRRSSGSWNNGYDHTGPESMMNRIFDAALKKYPIR